MRVTGAYEYSTSLLTSCVFFPTIYSTYPIAGITSYTEVAPCMQWERAVRLHTPLSLHCAWSNLWTIQYRSFLETSCASTANFDLYTCPKVTTGSYDIPVKLAVVAQVFICFSNQNNLPTLLLETGFCFTCIFNQDATIV